MAQVFTCEYVLCATMYGQTIMCGHTSINFMVSNLYFTQKPS